MEILLRLLMVLEAIVCFMLIGIVLLQRSKGDGAALSFGGGGAEAVFGAQMGNVLTRATVVLGIIFMANTTLIAAIRPKGGMGSVTDRIAVEAAQKDVALPSATAVDEQTAAALDSMVVDQKPAEEAAQAPDSSKVFEEPLPTEVAK